MPREAASVAAPSPRGVAELTPLVDEDAKHLRERGELTRRDAEALRKRTELMKRKSVGMKSFEMTRLRSR